MRYLALVVLFCVAGFTQVASACSCIDIRTFCESINNGSGINPSYRIVLAEVDKKMSDGMEIEVRDVLFGSDVPARIWLRKGNGADCLVNTEIFEKGEQYLFALWSWEDQFTLSICGVNWLEVRNGTVYGNIAPGINKVDLDELQDVVACAGLGGQLSGIRVGPNPTNFELRVSSTAPIDQSVALTIYDITGRRISQQVIQIPGDDYTNIDVRGYPSGIYIVVAELNGIMRTYKIVVQST